VHYFEAKSSARCKDYFSSAHLELTYRCGYNCVHCYCKGMEKRFPELPGRQVIRILDKLYRQGCVWLTLSGGDPLAHPDFWSIYRYAKSRGFLVTILTSAYSLTKKQISELSRFPPYSIEVTVNGITPRTYEKVTRVKGSFARAMSNIRALKENNITILIKSNCLKENKAEICRIKKWVNGFLGSPGEGKYYFSYDPLVLPRLDGDPCVYRHRLGLRGLDRVRKQDCEMEEEYREYISDEMPDGDRPVDALYRCNSWKSRCIIGPSGRVKFCLFSDKFSFDALRTPLVPGIERMHKQILRQRFRTDSPCRNCGIRWICASCPAVAYLETGDEEKPVEYFCRMAKDAAGKTRKAHE